MTNDQMKSQTDSTKAGTYTATGFVPSQATKNYCFKCGKPKSEHKFLQGCPK